MPSFLQKINYIAKFVADPCDAPITVYARAAIPALMKLVASYFAIDIIQIITGWTRPTKALRNRRRSGPHGSPGNRGKPKNKKGTLGKILSWDPYEELGKKLPGAAQMANREIPAGAAKLWALYNIEQRIAYYWMIVGLATDFFYDWLSGVAKSDYCDARNESFVVASADDAIGLGILRYTPYPFQHVEKQRGLAGVFLATYLIDGHMCEVIASCDITLYSQYVPSSQWCIAVSSVETGETFYGTNVWPNGGTSTVSFSIPNGTEGIMYIYSDGGNLSAKNGYFYAHGGRI